MASFQDKIGWKMPGKREYKKVSFCFVSTRRVIENSQKIAKNSKIPLWHHFKPK